MTKPCPGPNPVKRPKLRVPENACDTHIHVIGPYDRYPMVAERTYTCPEAPTQMVTEFLGIMGLNRAVIVHVTVSGMDPQVTLDAIADMDGNARGIVILDPDTSDAEMTRLTDCGIRGARLTPLFGDKIDAAAVTILADKIAPYGWHMLFMPSNPEEWLELAPLLGNLPVDVVIDHMAWRGWRVEDGLDQPGFKALRDLADTGRAWIKFGGMYRFSRELAPWPDLNPYAEAIAEARPDRVIWGTDWPHVRMWNTPMPDDDAILDWLGEVNFSEDLIEKILVDNPAAHYGFED